MTRDDRQSLREKALAATPGPWESTEEQVQDGTAHYIGPLGQHDRQFCVVADCDPLGSTRIAVASVEGERSEVGYLQDRADAAYITAWSPDVGLSLLSDLDRLEQENARLREALGTANHAASQMATEITLLRSGR